MRTGQNSVVTVTMEEQSRSFAYDKRQAVKGVLQIKQKDRAEVDLKAENLSPGTYRLFFIGRKNGNSVYKMIGEMFPDRNGRVSFNTEIDPADVDGEGTGLSRFYIFMLAAAGTPLRPVLKGDLVEQRTASRKEYNSYYSEFIRDMIEGMIGQSRGYMDISPFGDVWLADNWRRATDVMELPVASVGAREQCVKYGHFIFAYDETRFLLAVPGRHTEEEWPDRGASGFLMWQSIRGSGEYGYWCMVIERNTGIITEIS